MLQLNVNQIKYNYIDYYNKLVLKKNLQNPIFFFKKKKKDVFIKTTKLNNSKIVTLRAPKHFKVGRHHYQILTKLTFIVFNNFKFKIKLENLNELYFYLNLILNLLKKKKISKLLSSLNKITLTVDITENFKLT